MKFFKQRKQIWVDWNARRSGVAWVMSNTLASADKNSDAVSGFKENPVKPYCNLEGPPYMGDEVRTAIWTFSLGGGHFIFHADADQETVRTGIMGYDPHVPKGDKGIYKRDWIGYASRFFNEHVTNLDSMIPSNNLVNPGTYCLADPGREYVIYSKTGAPLTFTLNLTATNGKTIKAHFFNPRTGIFLTDFQRTGGKISESFTKPDSYDWILHLHVM